MTYGEWLRQQPPERQDASLAHMENCARLGRVNQTDPSGPEAQELRGKIADYYKENAA